ncbi:MAG: LysM peptidoglycan-binding domain-containing protein [Planctomycetes bacterium]|nr:LysM peptidoglycan-binding domain-containing protein [Planctomycetota bacterium]
MKISFVLFLLLIGTVTAFFFRNEPDNPEALTPHLENPEALAEELQDTEGPKPYFQNSSLEKGRNQKFVKFNDIEFDDEFPAFTDSSFDFEKTSSYEELPAARVKNRSLTQEENWFGDRPRTPSPIVKREAAAQNHQTVKRSSPQHAWDALSNRAINKVKPERATSTWEIRIHRVRPGETLSSLATYYLGSDSRYMELYRFNTDVLKNPNRLQVGMTLRIPPANQSRTVSAGTVTTQTVPTLRTPKRAARWSNDRSSSATPQKKRRTTFPRFLPVRRSPFSPGQRRRSN